MKKGIVLILLGLAVPAQAQVTFSDSTFLDADWTSTVLTLNHPGAGGFTAHVASGGNPGDHRALTSLSCVGNNPCKIMLIEVKPSAVFDPSTQGPILSLSYSEDQLCASVDGCVGGGQGWLPVCLQAGKFYLHSPGAPSGVLNAWTTRSLAGLVAADFGEVLLTASGMLDPGSNPDFSTTGSPIQFGYARANSVSSERTGRIDNWSVVVMETPVAANHSSWGTVKGLFR